MFFQHIYISASCVLADLTEFLADDVACVYIILVPIGYMPNYSKMFNVRYLEVRYIQNIKNIQRATFYIENMHTTVLTINFRFFFDFFFFFFWCQVDLGNWDNYDQATTYSKNNTFFFRCIYLNSYQGRMKVHFLNLLETCLEMYFYTNLP